ncbi:nuclease-related domain-containing protein [Halobacillus salinus]|uniref:nuclease-related domain-containing protein n=1 Tax=Halobacillus salinus TaxID=192814 RepID=UPI001115DA63|nr:nuclease-related domain-containing protein [Halobacillus salinus]
MPFLPKVPRKKEETDALSSFSREHSYVKGSYVLYLIHLLPERKDAMPPFKSRTKPLKLTLIEMLTKRMPLPPHNQRESAKWKKGYDGELRFDRMIEPYESDSHLLHNLLLQHNSTTFQIDTFMITSEKNYLFEIKNYEGDFKYEADKFYRLPESELLNPLHQLQRAHALLAQLMPHQMIESYLLFINPNFTLYQAPLHPSLVLPTQLDAFLLNIQSRLGPLTAKHHRLAEHLHSLHTPDTYTSDLPTYTFDSLQKGIHCLECATFSLVEEGHYFHCATCGSKEKFSSAVLRMIHELTTLFPDLKLTTPLVYEWCGEFGSHKRIRQLLLKHFTRKGQSKWTYFE